MPAIVGIISPESPDECKRRLLSMLGALTYEAFYDSGTRFIDEQGCYLGWTSRRDCADLTPASGSRDGGPVLIISGELFPEGDTIRELRKDLPTVRQDDAQGVISRYEECGEAFVRELNGCFAGALVDRRRGRCLVFNDRFGVKRLFVHQEHETVYFATEAKALLRVLPETRGFDRTGLAEFLTCGCTTGARSLFTGISICPAASLWTIAKGKVIAKSVYFHRSEWEHQERLDEEHFRDRFDAAFASSVRTYSRASVPVAMSLTGGLDSRMVMACTDASPGQIPCYTFGSMYRDTYDVSIARRVARRRAQPHTVLELGQAFLQDFPRYLEGAVYRSDGYLGLSGAAEFYLNALARNVAPIRLTGNYGGELLRGVRTFKAAMPRPGFLDPLLERDLRDAVEGFNDVQDIDPLSFTLFHQAPNQGYGRRAIEESQVALRTPFVDNGLVKLVYRRPVVSLDGFRLARSVIGRHAPELLAMPTDRGDLGKTGRPGRMIRAAYREALFKGEYWANHGLPGWAGAVSSSVPWRRMTRLFLGRHKFEHFGRWFTNELSGYIRDTLMAQSSLPDCFDRLRVEHMVDSHLRGERNYVDEIDAALTVTLTRRMLLGS
jgi:asparagine synthase (glutamine-hydrolysing)